MKLVIEVNLDNAAFEDGMRGEIRSCLKQAAAKLEHTGRGLKPQEHRIRDTNGNTVGTVKVVED